jgi:hypothetical protein
VVVVALVEEGLAQQIMNPVMPNGVVLVVEEMALILEPLVAVLYLVELVVEVAVL